MSKAVKLAFDERNQLVGDRSRSDPGAGEWEVDYALVVFDRLKLATESPLFDQVQLLAGVGQDALEKVAEHVELNVDNDEIH
jgi:hypothetical protein